MVLLRRLTGLMVAPSQRSVAAVAGRPGTMLLTGLASALHYSALALTMWAQSEWPGAGSHTSAAIKADTSITRRQRRMLLDIYESFLKENQAKAARAGLEHPTDRPPTAPLLPQTTEGTVHDARL
jgi:hypothetical protein